MKKSFPKFVSAAAAAGILSLTLAACSGSAPAGSSSAPAPSSSAASSSAPATSAPATSSSAAAGSASTGTAAGANVCKKAMDAFTGANTDLSSMMTGDLTKMVETLNKSAADLNAIADEASDPTQKAAIQEMGKYWNDISAAAAANDAKKIQEIAKAAAPKDSKLMKATATVGKCSV
ncbi:hypothetical protein [Galactobacter caseinivorans]|uniref:hypothetical protein n=1 Tax=Galactobacter caseinivorans TaxID=2676123 RepID=UPI0018F5619E|nr:hypothetical protein [Galactobacter caseinivorans]